MDRDEPIPKISDQSWELTQPAKQKLLAKISKPIDDEKKNSMNYVDRSLNESQMSGLNKVNLNALDGINPALTRYGRTEAETILP